jgi:hypothetical protein
MSLGSRSPGRIPQARYRWLPVVFLVGCAGPTPLRITDLPPAARAVVTAHAGGEPDTALTVTRRGEGYEVSYRADGVLRRLELTSGGALAAIEEAVRYRPPVEGETARLVHAAASACEDFAELDATADPAARTQALARVEAAVKQVATVLPSGAAGLESPLGLVRHAAGAGNGRGAALAAVELYRQLVSLPEAATPGLPPQVALLDYAGFRLSLLAAEPRPDWTAVRRTVEEAGSWWDTLARRVHASGLRDLLGSVHQGMADALGARDLRALRLTARVELDAVDLLEGYFTEAYKREGGAAAPPAP